jgi:hypothetical protein
MHKDRVELLAVTQNRLSPASTRANMTVKLPLAVRKNGESSAKRVYGAQLDSNEMCLVKDVFDSKLPEFQSRIEKALGVSSYTLQMDTPSLYSYALSNNMADNVGEIALAYFDGTITAIEVLTGNGTDTVAVDAFKKLTGKGSMTLQASSFVIFSGVEFKEGMLVIMYNPDWLWMGAKVVGENLHQAMDIGIFIFLTHLSIRSLTS